MQWVKRIKFASLMKIDLRKQNFENIKIENTSLVGANFVQCMLSGSQFNNVDISGVNLNGAILFNCKWRNMKIQELNKLDGQSASVNSVCFSPDGTTLASCGERQGANKGNSIRLWDIKTGQQKSKLDGHKGFVSSVCFSPDGSMLASGDEDISICFWDVKTGQLKYKLDGHSHYIRSVCFSPDGIRLASGTDDNSLRLWDVKTGKEIQSSDKSYKDILAQFKHPIFQNNPPPESASSNFTILLISQTPLFQVQGALVLKGEFINFLGVDLRSLLKSKGSFFLEEYKVFLQKQNDYYQEHYYIKIIFYPFKKVFSNSLFKKMLNCLLVFQNCFLQLEIMNLIKIKRNYTKDKFKFVINYNYLLIDYIQQHLIQIVLFNNYQICGQLIFIKLKVEKYLTITEFIWYIYQNAYPLDLSLYHFELTKVVRNSFKLHMQCLLIFRYITYKYQLIIPSFLELYNNFTSLVKLKGYQFRVRLLHQKNQYKPPNQEEETTLLSKFNITKYNSNCQNIKIIHLQKRYLLIKQAIVQQL